MSDNPFGKRVGGGNPFGRAASAEPQPDDSRLRGFALGALKPIDKAATMLEQGFNALTGSEGKSAATAAAENAVSREANTRKGAQLVGGIAATAALPGGPLVQGATGGVLMSDATDVGGMATDGAIGAGGGYVGDKLVRGVAQVIGPKVAPVLAKLRGEGVSVTPGQAARAGDTFGGKLVADTEDRLTTLPIVGGMIEAGRDTAQDGFNRAIVNRALKPIGETLPKAVAVGHDAIAFAGDKLRQAYSAVLPNLRGQLDNQFVTRVQAIRTRADLPAEYAKQLDEVTQGVLSQAFDTSGRYVGKSFQRVSDRLDKLAATWSKSADDAWNRELGDAVGSIREQLHALARRQNPRYADQLRKADNGWASLVRAERAALGSADGVATPKQYAAAVRVADRSVRKRAVARGEARDQDLAKAGAKVLPSDTGSSGTAERVANASMFSWGLGALAAPVYAAARGVTPIATRQAGPTALRLGDLVRRSAPAGTAAGATMAPLIFRPE